MIAIDTETTGLDLNHGASPFFVSICFEGGRQLDWCWDVDYKTRKVQVVQSDVEEIQHEVSVAGRIVGHNLGFDVRALMKVGVSDWDWSKCHDTMYSGHLLNSSMRQNLEDQVLYYLRRSVREYDEACEEATKKARRICSSRLPLLRIAEEGDSLLPSLKGEKVWKSDLALMMYLCKNHVEELPEWEKQDGCMWKPGDDPLKHPWMFLNKTYGNVDTVTTFLLHKRHMELIEERGLQDIYEERRKGLEIVFNMENNGINYSTERSSELEDEYRKEETRNKKICEGLAKTYGCNLSMPKGGRNKALDEFVFDEKYLGLEPVELTKKGNPALNKEAVMKYQLTLPDNSREKLFIDCLAASRLRSTGLTAIQSYNRFLVKKEMKLFPGFNPCGTTTLRWTSANPSGQTISKKTLGERGGFNLRYAFGPAEGMEWFSLDYNNLELRLTAYESGEPAMVDIFERPNEGPYYGSYHLLIFDILHPDLFKKYGVDVKDIFKATWYGRTKNGNFADQYGAVKKSKGDGTADKAYGVTGAQVIISEKLTEKDKLNKKWVDFANENGYVYTVPDSEVNPTKGYPIRTPRERGRVKPTIPLNYRIQGTACWVVWRAMIKCHNYLAKVGVGRILLNVHDELVFEFPKGEGVNHWPKLKQIMESIGGCINVPLTVGVDYHDSNWGEGVGL